MNSLEKRCKMKEDTVALTWTDWRAFDEGRARFSGMTRGWDEAGHETFAVELHGQAWYGEIKKQWRPDGLGYDLEILSFGYTAMSEVGMPLDPGSPLIGVFPLEDIDTVQMCVLKLIATFADLQEKPSVLSEKHGAKFSGRVSFRDHWALVVNGNGAAS
jgi:hypothetical protein